jgi:hypothetical protein
MLPGSDQLEASRAYALSGRSEISAWLVAHGLTNSKMRADE